MQIPGKRYQTNTVRTFWCTLTTSALSYLGLGRFGTKIWEIKWDYWITNLSVSEKLVRLCIYSQHRVFPLLWWYFPVRMKTLLLKHSQQTFLVFQDVFSVTLFVFQDLLKTSSRRLENVFAIRLPKTSSRRFQGVFKSLPRRLQDVFKMSSRRVCKTSCNYVFKTSSRRVCKMSCNYVFKTSSRRVCKMSCNYVFKTSSRRLQDVVEDKRMLHWRRLEDVLKTSSVCLHQDECLLG